ncbi:hypothetical protein OM999_03855 [Mycoplasmopsis cynos]|uniref:hypothetical protein n=1 Tax=Mycoplasmopsis cynos TaxID=171284 RepID=UPI0024C61C0A|nr:hypothetical protein OM999_03855 [Mycoplasmopsis cynos]
MFLVTLKTQLLKPESLPSLNEPISAKLIAALIEIIPPKIKCYKSSESPSPETAFDIEAFLKNIPIPTTDPIIIAIDKNSPIFLSLFIVFLFSFH